MDISVAGQTAVFLEACVFGLLIGFLYDVFRIFRIMVPCGRIAVFFQDLLYFILCAGGTFAFLLYTNEGEIRFFIVLGVLLGATLYYFTIGMLVIRSARVIVRFLKKFFRAVAGILARPLCFAARGIRALFKAIGGKSINLFKNKSKSVKTHLQDRKNMVYNQRQTKKMGKERKKDAKRHPRGRGQ